MLLIISLLINIVFVVIYFSVKNYNNSLYERIKFENDLRDVRLHFILKYKEENTSIKALSFISYQNKACPIQNIIKEKKEIFYIPNNACDVCVAALMEAIRKLNKNSSNLIYLIESSKNKDILLFSEKYNISPLNVFCVNDQNISNSSIASTFGTPYFFSISQYGKKENVFIMTPGNIDLLKYYLPK